MAPPPQQQNSGRIAKKKKKKILPEKKGRKTTSSGKKADFPYRRRAIPGMLMKANEGEIRKEDREQDVLGQLRKWIERYRPEMTILAGKMRSIALKRAVLDHCEPETIVAIVQLYRVVALGIAKEVGDEVIRMLSPKQATIHDLIRNFRIPEEINKRGTRRWKNILSDMYGIRLMEETLLPLVAFLVNRTRELERETGGGAEEGGPEKKRGGVSNEDDQSMLDEEDSSEDDEEAEDVLLEEDEEDE